MKIQPVIILTKKFNYNELICHKTVKTKSANRLKIGRA